MWAKLHLHRKKQNLTFSIFEYRSAANILWDIAIDKSDIEGAKKYENSQTSTSHILTSDAASYVLHYCKTANAHYMCRLSCSR